MMKIIATVFTAVICLTFSGCTKEYSVENPDAALNGPASFTATVDGAQFVAQKESGATKASGVIGIVGISTDGEQIVLRVADSGVHVYSLERNSTSNVGGYSKGNDYAYTTNQGITAEESDGTLSITEIDTLAKTMTGNFSMKVYRQMDASEKHITKGVFTNIPYQTTILPISNSADTFMVKTDGTQFAVTAVNALPVSNTIVITGSNTDLSQTVSLSFPANITTGTYNFSSSGLDYIAQYNIGSSYLIANSGTLTILEHNTTSKKIRGNFNFKANELAGSKNASLTEGYFSVVY